MNFIVLILAIAFFSVAQTITFRLLISEGHIFSFYGRWISNLKNKYAKPLGGCAFCFNIHCTWISYFIAGLVFNFTVVSLPFLLCLIPTLAVSTFFLIVYYNIHNYYYEPEDADEQNYLDMLSELESRGGSR